MTPPTKVRFVLESIGSARIADSKLQELFQCAAAAIIKVTNLSEKTSLAGNEIRSI